MQRILKAPADESIADAVEYIKQQSTAFRDGLFAFDYDFLVWIEQQFEQVNGRHESLPLELEQFWRDRVSQSMGDLLYSLFVWIYPNRATARGFFDWLESVYMW